MNSVRMPSIFTASPSANDSTLKLKTAFAPQRAQCRPAATKFEIRSTKSETKVPS